MSHCRKCGTAIKEGVAFCPSCGSQTGDPTAGTVALEAMPEHDPLLRQLKKELSEDYEVEEELGRGGMAVVYKGIERMLERVVAIKVLPPEMAHAGDTAERFKREARLAASLDHPNIIPIYRVGQKGDLYYMAMKFVEGRALDAILEDQGALPFAVILQILTDAARALAFAHERKIIHRDIKGGNILIDTDGRVLVSDFGIARAMGETSLTASGMVIGTPNYMSPEQCAGQQLGPQADQYSLGVLGFQMLTGQLPFDADSIMGVIQHHYMTPPPDITEVRKGVPDGLVGVVYKLMEKKPAGRFKRTSDLVDALTAIPTTEVERREGTEVLKLLARGNKIDLVRTGSLPPLRIQPTTDIPEGLRQATELLKGRRKKKRGVVVPLVTALALVGGGGGALWQFVLKDRLATTSAPPPTQDTARGVPVLPGQAAFTGLPPGATVDVAGRVLAGGSGTVDEGTWVYTITAQGYETETGRITITAGQTTAIPITMRQVASRPARPAQQPAAPAGIGYLTVSVDPVQAQISVDGQRVGAGRLFRNEIPAGQRRVRIELEGYMPLDTTITVGVNERVSLGRVVLRERGQ